VSSVVISYHTNNYQPVEIFYEGSSIGLVPEPSVYALTKTITLDAHWPAPSGYRYIGFYGSSGGFLNELHKRNLQIVIFI